MTKPLLPLLCLLILITLMLPSQTQATLSAEPNAIAAAPPADPNDPNAVIAAEAEAEQEIETELQKWIVKLRDAGATIPVLLLLSIIGLSLILERFWALRRRNFAPRSLIDDVSAHWDTGNFDKVAKICRFRRCTYATVISFIVTHRKGAIQDISTTAGDIAARDLRRHLLRAYPLAVIATVAPLLGLLGTVSGMVGAFDTVAMMGELGDAGALGGDISKALVTTLVGLVVAIPSLFAYHFFKARTQFFGVIVEEELTTFITDKLMKKETDNAD